MIAKSDSGIRVYAWILCIYVCIPGLLLVVVVVVIVIIIILLQVETSSTNTTDLLRSIDVHRET